MSSSQQAAIQAEKSKIYKTDEALHAVSTIKCAKFDESVDISLHIGVDARKTMVRGVCPMPAGLGKKTKVAVFARGDAAEQAQKAGADRVGAEDLVDEILNKAWEGYDVVIATPDMMGLVGKLARKLGPKGLMPNPKLGTVSEDVAAAVTSSKAGQAKFKIDKASIIHCSIGKSSFKPEQLKENLDELIRVVKKLKPAAAKGQYLKKLYVSTTMSKASLRVDLAEYTN